ncbi:MAG: signal peptidase I [Lachnospiraceae bacterium]|nr:signal peptidase I [Lachnospiraceae bacterium]
MLKKFLLKGLNVISILLIICSLGVLLTVVMTKKGEAPNVLGYSLFRVMTGSMEPNIPTNSLIVVHRIEPGKLEEGDVISFYSRDPSLMGEVNTHRIVGIEEVGGRYIFSTKGDANNVEDQYVTYGEDVIGKVVFSSYRLGQGVRLISNPLLFVPLIIIPLVIMLGHSLWESITLAAKLAREEEEAAVREALEAIRKKREAEKSDGETEDKK